MLAGFCTTGARAADPQIAAGSNHTCSVSQVGVLRCMGLNEFGQLGVLTNVSTSNPLISPQVVQLGGVVAQVAAGLDHTCAVLTNGLIKCFGGNASGQLGSPLNNGVGAANPGPQTVPLAGPAATVSAGQHFTCALLQSGGVQCWGSNQNGPLGVALNAGTVNPNPTPQTVVLAGPAIKLEAGQFQHVCAVLVGGGVQCWGANFYGNLASTTNAGISFTPLLPVGGGVSGVSTDAAAGGGHSCALKQDASLECFGFNQYGQLGNTTNLLMNVPNPSPTAVAIGAPVTQVVAGYEFTCAVTTGGGVSCFGNNREGQLGSAVDNGVDVAHATPTAVAGLAGPVLKLSAGHQFVCAIIQSGPVQCWGWNGAGQLGQDPSTLMFSAPVTVAGLSLFDAPPPPLISLTVNKPKLKSKKSGRKVLVTSTLTIQDGSGSALNAQTCTGQFTTTLTGKVKNKRTGKTRNKRYARKTFSAAMRGDRCQLRLKLKLQRSLMRKRMTLAVVFPGSPLVNPLSQSFKVRIPTAR